ncbi:MAG: leucine-rich repeat protein [Clostridia bacterium]|nr:leucine-rich repeat protein [Clostridia bacterium]
MKNTIRYSLSLIIAMLLCIIIAPCAFAEDTVYTTSDVTGGVRIDSVTTTETKLVIPEEIGGKVVVALAGKAFTGTPVEEITVPAGVTSMNSYIAGDYSAFYGMENLKKVTFAEGMRTIPSGTLSGCTTVTQVVLPESITTISDDAFYGCTALETINLPDSITSIGEEAFYNCTSLAAIELPEELKEIYDGAFALCSKIKAITLPDSLTIIEGLAFYKTQISEITVPANVTTLCSYEGIYNVSSKDYSAFFGMDYLEKVTFAEGMKAVPASALMNCNGVKEVILPESLTAISDEAFYGCSSLTTINFPDSITFIGEEAFYNCTSLTAIELPEELKEIYDGAFALCSKIKAVTLPDSLTKIEGLAFYKTQISEITVPANVTTLYSYEGINNVSSNDYSAFFGMDYLEKVTFAEGMKAVPYGALTSCTSVTEVVLPESLMMISDYSFYNCTALKNINLPDSVISIGNSAFYNCKSLTDVTLSSSLTSINKYAFEGCEKLEEIVLPESVTNLGIRVFYGTKISEIIIPAGMENMYGYTEYLKENAWGYSHEHYSSLFGMQFLTKITFSDGMNVIPKNATYGCFYLKEVVIYDCNTSLEAMQADAEANGYTLTVLPCGECQHENTEIRNAVAVTCLENGYTGDTYCTDCEELITEGEVIAAAGSHDYKSETVKAATCEAEGEVKYTCSVCGDSYTEATEKDPANHTGDTEIRDAKEATCSAKGYTGDTYCKACGAKLEAGTETEKTAHTEVVVKGSDAKCTAPGMTDGTECSVCGTVIKAQEEIPATGHTYGEWTVVKNPTATEEGVEERICTSCGEAEARTIEKLSYIVGDVNGDGRITAADARLALRIAAHIDTIEALGTSLVVCDITLDNKVTAADARIILRKAAGLE